MHVLYYLNLYIKAVDPVGVETLFFLTYFHTEQLGKKVTIFMTNTDTWTTYHNVLILKKKFNTDGIKVQQYQ
jgi:hypothetical protein